MPINFPRDDFAGGIKQLRDAEKAGGRKKLGISLFGSSSKEDEIKRLADLGFDRLIFPLPAAPRETVLPLLDKYAEVAAKMH